MRLSIARFDRLSIYLLIYLIVLGGASQSTAHGVQWQEGKLVESEPLDPNRATTPKFRCLLFENAIHTVETEDLSYKFIGSPLDFALAPDKDKLKFRVFKDGHVAVQDKKGHEQQTSLRVYTKTTKVSQPLAALPSKIKNRDWRVANVTRMQPMLFSLDMPWLLSTPEPPCPLHFSVIRGWALELEAQGTTYEVVQKGSEPPAIAVSSSVRIAEKNKKQASVIDEAGKQRKFTIVKKTIQNSLGP